MQRRVLLRPLAFEDAGAVVLQLTDAGAVLEIPVPQGELRSPAGKPKARQATRRKGAKAQRRAPAAAQKAAVSKTATSPRTPWGHPDLQGVWANNNATPLERPKELAGKKLLTDAEFAAVKAKAAELFSGDGDAAFGDSVFVTAVTNASKFDFTNAHAVSRVSGS